MDKINPSKKIVILKQRSPYHGDKDHFYVVTKGDQILKQLILDFAQAVHFALTLEDKIYYRDEFLDG